MVSREGLLMGVVWIVFFLVLGFLTAKWLGGAAAPVSLGFKLILLGILLVIATIEAKLTKDEPGDYDSLSTQTYQVALNSGVTLSLVISILLDLWGAKDAAADTSTSTMFFATSIYLLVFLVLRTFHDALLSKKVL